MTEAWVRWWIDGGDYPRNSRWSKWHHVTARQSGEQRIDIVDGRVRTVTIADDRLGPAVGELPCRPYGFRIPAGAEYRDDRPPRADSCTPCIRRLDPGMRPFALPVAEDNEERPPWD